MTMIISLFEIFDPLIGSIQINNIVVLISITTPLIIWFYITKTRNSWILLNIKKYIFSELGARIANKSKQDKLSILFTIFLLILLLNLIGIMPYVFTLTRQMFTTLSIALPLWLAILLFRIFQNTTHFIRHLVPLSTPMALSHFITLIESISLLIRPITLSVRLCANITAGHILMALISRTIYIFNIISIPLTILLILEIAVAFIQRYVFTILLSIYLRETE